jgi:hypothetical protein
MNQRHTTLGIRASAQHDRATVPVKIIMSAKRILRFFRLWGGHMISMSCYYCFGYQWQLRDAICSFVRLSLVFGSRGISLLKALVHILLSILFDCELGQPWQLEYLLLVTMLKIHANYILKVPLPFFEV